MRAQDLWDIYITLAEGRSLNDERAQEAEQSDEESKEVHSFIGGRELH